MARVLVAMSGGVDSSVAACLLKEQGHDCIGVFMRVGSPEQESEVTCPTDLRVGQSMAEGKAIELPVTPRRLKHGCCSASDAMDARAIAARLEIPFYALNFENDFEKIIDYFVGEYALARTPNPCVRCNIDLKFGKLFRYADMMDAQYVATGHYARVLHQGGQSMLAQSANPAKDQSYVLFGIRRADLGRCLFPLGEMADKAEVRRIAEDLGLRVHDKPDSQEICFVPSGDYRDLLGQRRPELNCPGDILDLSGQIVGQHQGVAHYTIGQRRGLNLAMGDPVYVTHIDPERNTITIGPRQALESAGLTAALMNWLTDPPAAPRRVLIKIRHQHTPVSGLLTVSPSDSGRVRATFDVPQLAVTPGQAAVFYDPEGTVLGGGWIESGSDQELTCKEG
jgi:tRNA-specific 2-thiouridylase